MSAGCPSASDLKQFVDESISSDAKRVEISNHLDECNACQALLDDWLSLDPVQADLDSKSTESVEKLIDQLVSNRPQSVRSESSLVGKRLGEYEILESIGRGTSGVVYRARDSRLVRDVAIKVLRSDFASSDRARTRLEREARAAASLQQQNIVGVYDVCIDPIGVSYLVMELVEGETLRSKIRSEGAFESKRAGLIARQLLSGLMAAHSKGLVHRDLKSANILLENDAPIPKLTDFGLVRDLESDSNLTRDNVIAGTPAYMSPEQVLKPNSVDHRADLYSLGVVIYEMVSGELPFLGVDRMVLKQVIHDEPRPLRRHNDSISRDLETICFKAMSKNPDARYENALTMQQDLDRWLENKPILARRMGVIGRTWNWSKRNSRVASLLAFSALLLALLTIGSTISAVMIRSASLEKDRQTLAAKRQRDQSMETLRELVFDVNELLEPGNVDMDEVQEELLNVALKGISQIKQTGDEAGVLDVSTIAARNRLGDVYYRLSDFDEARMHFESARSMISKISTQADHELILTEELRSLEGLVSIALETEKSDEAETLMESAERVAKRLRDEFGSDLFPAYFVDVEFEMTHEEIEQLEFNAKTEMSALPESGSQIEAVAEMVQTIVASRLDYDEDVEHSRRLCVDLLNWVNSVDAEAKSIELQAAIWFGKYQGYSGLANIAFLENEADVHLAMLRKSVDVLPRDARGEFVETAELEAYASLGELIATIEEEPAELWMIKYFKAHLGLVQKSFDAESDDVRLAESAIFYSADYIRVLFDCNELEAAKVESETLKQFMDSFDLSKLSRSKRRQLNRKIEGLKKRGLTF